jgi:hypothetical protein
MPLGSQTAGPRGRGVKFDLTKPYQLMGFLFGTWPSAQTLPSNDVGIDYTASPKDLTSIHVIIHIHIRVHIQMANMNR